MRRSKEERNQRKRKSYEEEIEKPTEAGHCRRRIEENESETTRASQWDEGVA